MFASLLLIGELVTNKPVAVVNFVLDFVMVGAFCSS